MKRPAKQIRAKSKKASRKSAPEPRPPSKSNAKRSGGNQPFPIVGVGASAGGLEAFRELLNHLPTDIGIALVLVQHLDPKHESMLAELLSRSTKMAVSEVQDRMTLAPNHIFVIPRNRDMTIRGGVLRLTPRASSRSPHHSIDAFFRSLAEDQKNRAIGVILSGTASDGTLGLEAIKAEGGITFAQDTESAKYDGMPRSAIASGCVDFVLPPAGIAKELARISSHPYLVADKLSTTVELEAESKGQDGFKRILNILAKASGVDFTLYKGNTLNRRMMRRMMLNRSDGYDQYARYLNGHPQEVENLYQDILINVTRFFRDPETFELLKKKIFPRVLERRSHDDPVRIWVPGCSTGEEAYSIAMAFVEFAGEQASHIPVQIFATDVNDRAVAKARNGFYEKNITADVTPERLRRFFTEDNGGYRVSKPIRDMCVFAKQNVLFDPPFSRMDLISCRNLLIYLEPAAQTKVLPVFHYALKPHGFLWLGSSETIGAATDLFEVEDKKNRIYSKKRATHRVGFDFANVMLAQQTSELRPVGIKAAAERSTDEAVALKEADKLILSRFAPGSVLVSDELEIVQFRGRTAPYLEPPSGKASLNLLKMAREGLLNGLRTAINKARKGRDAVRREDLTVKYEGRYLTVNLEVIPIKRSGSTDRFFLVLFEPVDSEPVKKTKGSSVTKRAARSKSNISRVSQLEHELDATSEYLQSVVEQYEAANEELQSANEEVQSSNEELQSINEELETAKEELESSNEELTTVNDELQNRNVELGRANSDLINLLDSIHMPLVMLDNQLRIRRFNTSAEKSLNLITTDIGRQITDIKTNIDRPDLTDIITEVIDTVTVKELEVQDTHGRWYLMRIRPYKTIENKIDGATVMLIDIEALKLHEKEIQESREYAEAIVETVLDPLIILDENLRVHAANDSFYETFKVTPQETVGRLIYELGSGQWDIQPLRTLLTNVLESAEEFSGFEVSFDFPSICRMTVQLNAREVRQGAGKRRLILLGIRDVTAEKEMEEGRTELVRAQAARVAAEDANRIKDEFLAICSHELRAPLSAIQGWAEILTRRDFDEETSRHGLEIILRNVQAQTQIIRDLLDVSRVIAGKLQLVITPVELVPLMEAAVESARPSAEAKDIKLSASFDRSIDMVFGDAVRLQQIVMNLISNAVKFTPVGGAVDVRLQREDDRFAIVVRDTGVGIEPEFLPHVFELFRQADSRTTRRFGGLGLGLAIVRNLTTMHGGTVRAASDGLGKGSTFEVILPLKPPELEPAVEPETRLNLDVDSNVRSISERVSPLADVRVLVVDDDRDSLEMLNAALTAFGGEVRTCPSSEEALKTLQEWRPDVIVSDIGMPNADGYSLIQKVRALPSNRGGNIPALALTGYATLEDHKRALSAGYQMHISKPVELSKLAATVTMLIDRNRSVPGRA
jgi:two-component system CheB/CheR fusion protein